jgi:hypothetical protein
MQSLPAVRGRVSPIDQVLPTKTNLEAGIQFADAREGSNALPAFVNAS